MCLQSRRGTRNPQVDRKQAKQMSYSSTCWCRLLFSFLLAGAVGWCWELLKWSLLFLIFYLMFGQELSARQADLRNLSTGTFDPLTALGGYMPGLVRMIHQNANKVSQEPC